MKKLILFSLLSLALLPYSFAQSVGDFRSVSAVGNWNATGTWQTWNGSSWVTAGSLPTSSTSVYIRQVDNITVTIPNGYNASCASLILGDNSNDKNVDLVISGNGTLTVNGNLDFHRPNGWKIPCAGMRRFIPTTNPDGARRLRRCSSRGNR